MLLCKSRIFSCRITTIVGRHSQELQPAVLSPPLHTFFSRKKSHQNQPNHYLQSANYTSILMIKNRLLGKLMTSLLLLFHFEIFQSLRSSSASTISCVASAHKTDYACKVSYPIHLCSKQFLLAIMGTPAVARFARQITFSSVISYLGKPHFHHRYFQKKETFSSRESELFFFKCQMKQRFGHRSAKWPTNDCCHGWYSPSCTSTHLFRSLSALLHWSAFSQKTSKNSKAVHFKVHIF